MNKDEKTIRFKSTSSSKRKELILKKIKAKGLKVGSGVPNKKYDGKEIYDLIHLTNYL